MSVDWKMLFDIIVGLTIQGYKEVIITYNGYGDSGFVDDIVLVKMDGTKLKSGIDIERVANGLYWLLMDFGYFILGKYFGGWEINEGSWGEIIFDLEESKMICDHKAREYFSEEIDLDSLSSVEEIKRLKDELAEEVDKLLQQDEYEGILSVQGGYFGDDDTVSDKLEKHFYRDGQLDDRVHNLISLVLSNVDPHQTHLHDAEFEDASEIIFRKGEEDGGKVKVIVTCYGEGWCPEGFEKEIGKFIREVI